jgi:predicted dehydrogenase
MQLRVGVVGYGYWGSKHVRVLDSIPEVNVTVIDSDSNRCMHARRSFSRVDTAENLEEVMFDLDAVVIATLPSSHVPLAEQALAAGLHVLVEKPLALTTDGCRSLISAADATDAVLMVGHTFEYNAAILKLEEIVKSGELGQLLYIDFARLNLGLYQPDVNVIWDLAPHDISIANLLLGSRPSTVAATAEAHLGGPREDVAHLQLHYDEIDVTAYIRVSWLDPAKVRRVTVVGDRKMCVNNDSSDEPIRIYDKGVEPVADDGHLHEMPLQYRYGDITLPRVSTQEPLFVQDSHFVECVRLGDRPRTDGDNGMAVVSVLEAATQSLAAGGQPQPVWLECNRSEC